ncbi:hypothetical protein PV328_008420 [Microctonus aethiopoides]|uniref:FP protein C-terminal domain-containing protein n=1 Tax=Microctonus aethiopoides TaxID=144406 RepID=A0AA39FJA7_9HYME|nr:hypothetical protein PV328_008420 [Microctonus aethiopoides]
MRRSQNLSGCRMEKTKLADVRTCDVPNENIDINPDSLDIIQPLEPRFRETATQNNARNSNQADRTVNDSLIIKFKSEHIVKYVIDCKRRMGKLILERLFGTDINGVVYINEFLNSTKHELYLKAKDKVRSHKWKYVWILEGNIYVRQDDGKDKIKILTASDLDLITSSI